MKMATFPTISSIAGQHALAYETFFKQVDLKGKGNIGALQAANFLKKSELKESILSDIWDLADPQGRGYLDKTGFFVALKLIAVVQSGKDVDLKYLTLDLPPPSFEPKTCKSSISNVISNDAPKIINTTNDVKKDKDDWAIPLTERLKYDQIFDTLNPVNGLLPGSKVKPILLNSKLPIDILGQVWDLSDIDKDGSLDREEFSVAMNLVYKALQKIPLPSHLPSDMVPPTKRKQMSSTTTPATVAATTTTSAKTTVTSNSSAVGSKRLSTSGDDDASDNKPSTNEIVSKAPTRPPTAPPSSSSSSTSTTSIGWVVTPQAKAQCDELFVKADMDKDGYVSGAEIKKIFIKSGLPQPVLAKIWSLCDTKNQGKLNKDQFALAMHLIQQKLKGVDVPAKLTPEMVPPSGRRNSLGDNVPPPGIVYDMNSTGMKEIEVLTADIDKIKLSKQKLDMEKASLDETIRSFEDDFIALQQEIDMVVEAVKQLNNQKIEAQKRLNELDSKKILIEQSLKSTEEEREKHQKKAVELKEKLSNKENINKTLEEDLKVKRQELNLLRQQEMDVEMEFESSHRRLVQLSKLLHGSQVQITQAENNVELLADTNKQIMNSLRLYDAMITGEITEYEAQSLGDLQVSSPTLNFDLSSFDAMSDMVQISKEEMEEFQVKLIAIQSSVDDLDEDGKVGDNEGGDTANKDQTDNNKKDGSAEEDQSLWNDVPFAKATATNDPFAIGFITSDVVKSPVNPDDPFGQGAFAPPGAKPARPSRPPQPRTGGGGAPPPRPKSPAPQRSKSPSAPPARPKSPSIKSPTKTTTSPPTRPPAPSKSPLNVFSDDEDAIFSQIRGDQGGTNALDNSNAWGCNLDPGFAGFSREQFASDYDLK